MRAALTLFALAALAALLGVSIWASGLQGIGGAIADLAAHPAGQPWFVATLFDTYFAFLWFWLWVAHKERTWPARIAWLLLILSLGNLAMATYVLIQLARLPAGAGARELLLRRA